MSYQGDIRRRLAGTDFVDPRVKRLFNVWSGAGPQGTRLLHALDFEFGGCPWSGGKPVGLPGVTLEDLEALHDNQLLRIPNLGRKCLKLFREHVTYIDEDARPASIWQYR